MTATLAGMIAAMVGGFISVFGDGHSVSRAEWPFPETDCYDAGSNSWKSDHGSYSSEIALNVGLAVDGACGLR